MKMINTLRAVLLASIVLALAACSGKSSYEPTAPAPMMEGAGRAKSLAFDLAADEEAPSTGFTPQGPGDAAPATPADPWAATAGRKLVKTANLSIQVKELASAITSAESLAASLGGYISASRAGEDWASLTLRIPQESFDKALETLGPLGKVLNRSVNAEDVTLQFYDLEGRLKTKKDLAETFRAYLRRANTISDILAVEERLADLEAEIDGTGKQLKGLTDLIDFATISLELSIPASQSSVHREGLGEKLARLFGGFGSFLSGLATVLVGIVIYGIPLLLVIAGLWLLLFGKVGLMRKLWRLVSAKKKAQ